MALPAVASVLAIWPLSLAFGDYRVMLYAMLIGIALTTLLSHLLAERPYRLSFDRAVFRLSDPEVRRAARGLFD